MEGSGEGVGRSSCVGGPTNDVQSFAPVTPHATNFPDPPGGAEGPFEEAHGGGGEPRLGGPPHPSDIAPRCLDPPPGGEGGSANYFLNGTRRSDSSTYGDQGESTVGSAERPKDQLNGASQHHQGTTVGPISSEKRGDPPRGPVPL